MNFILSNLWNGFCWYSTHWVLFKRHFTLVYWVRGSLLFDAFYYSQIFRMRSFESFKSIVFSTVVRFLVSCLVWIFLDILIDRCSHFYRLLGISHVFCVFVCLAILIFVVAWPFFFKVVRVLVWLVFLPLLGSHFINYESQSLPATVERCNDRTNLRHQVWQGRWAPRED